MKQWLARKLFSWSWRVIRREHTDRFGWVIGMLEIGLEEKLRRALPNEQHSLLLAFQILTLFSPDELERWEVWDKMLNEVNLCRKPASRLGWVVWRDPSPVSTNTLLRNLVRA